MIRALNLSGEFTKALEGSKKSTDTSASTFYSEGSPRKFGVNIIPKESEEDGEAFLLEEQAGPEAKTSYFEEPDSPQELPLLTPAPTLRDVTNTSPTNYVPPTKIGKLDDLSEPQSEKSRTFWDLK